MMSGKGPDDPGKGPDNGNKPEKPPGLVENPGNRAEVDEALGNMPDHARVKVEFQAGEEVREAEAASASTMNSDRLVLEHDDGTKTTLNIPNEVHMVGTNE